MQSTPEFRGLHAAIIMDGNGRWAAARGLPRIAGHRRGADSVRSVVEAAPGLGITTLTLYAFSSDNWKRPAEEVSELMHLLRTYLTRETARCVRNGVRVRVIGRRDRLATGLRKVIEWAEADTSGCDKLDLRIAVDYSARDMLARAATAWRGEEPPSREEFAQLLGEADHSGGPAPDVDFVVRTSGEQRLSDFLLWECAYAEFIFTDRLWPDFGAAELDAAVREFRSRDRRFGAVPKRAVG